VLGSPIAHSLSPVLHRTAYAALGLSDWTYDAYDVTEAALPEFIADLGDEWAGLSLTMPLKRVVIPLLDVIAPTAADVEAVNTVLFTPDGLCRGENTDVPGFVAALAEREVPRPESVTVLGAGATTASALAAIAAAWPGRPQPQIEVYMRTATRATELELLAVRLDLNLKLRDWHDAPDGLAAPLVVSTTPPGATDHLAERVPANPGTLFDVLYHPWPTPLAAAWSQTAGQVLSGLDLLLHQAALQVELITDHHPAPLNAMRAAVD
jgi:shikimate dehydrogenase